MHWCVPSRQVLRQHGYSSISGSPPTAMHRLCVHVYAACVLHPHECMHRMWLLYLVRIYTEARPEPPPRRVLLMCRMSALSHDSYLHLFRPPSRSVIPPLAIQSLMGPFVVLYLCLSVLQCLSSTSISLAPSPCNLSGFRFLAN